MQRHLYSPELAVFNFCRWVGSLHLITPLRRGPTSPLGTLLAKVLELHGKLFSGGSIRANIRLFRGWLMNNITSRDDVVCRISSSSSFPPPPPPPPPLRD